GSPSVGVPLWQARVVAHLAEQEQSALNASAPGTRVRAVPRLRRKHAMSPYVFTTKRRSAMTDPRFKRSSIAPLRKCSSGFPSTRTCYATPAASKTLDPHVPSALTCSEKEVGHLRC